MPITNTTRIIDLPTKSSLGSGDYFAVDNENGDTSKILASSVSGSSTAGLVAKEYSNAQTYGDGAIRIHVDNNVPNLYKANQDIQSPEAWTPAHWDPTDAGEEIEAANAAIASLNSNLTQLQFEYGKEVSVDVINDTSYTPTSNGFLVGRVRKASGSSYGAFGMTSSALNGGYKFLGSSDISEGYIPMGSIFLIAGETVTFAKSGLQANGTEVKFLPIKVKVS